MESEREDRAGRIGERRPSRRQVTAGLAAAAAAALVENASAQRGPSACDGATSEVIIPADRGTAPLRLEGQVFQIDGRTAAAGVLVYAHHTGASGLYDIGADGAPRRQAFMRTDAQGRFLLRTGMPAPYPNRTQPAHIHLHLWGQGAPHQWTEDVLFAEDPLLSQDVRQRSAASGRFAWVSAAPLDNGVRVVRRAIRLKARGDPFDRRMQFGLRTCGAP
jgi:protocatechuate 3,4-dioxygenase beta subunit